MYSEAIPSDTIGKDALTRSNSNTTDILLEDQKPHRLELLQPRLSDRPRRPARGRETAQGGPGSRLGGATATEGAGPGAGRDAPHKTRLDAREFAAKSTFGRKYDKWYILPQKPPLEVLPLRGCCRVRGGVPRRHLGCDARRQGGGSVCERGRRGEQEVGHGHRAGRNGR